MNISPASFQEWRSISTITARPTMKKITSGRLISFRRTSTAAISSQKRSKSPTARNATVSCPTDTSKASAPTAAPLPAVTNAIRDAESRSNRENSSTPSAPSVRRRRNTENRNIISSVSPISPKTSQNSWTTSKERTTPSITPKAGSVRVSKTGASPAISNGASASRDRMISSSMSGSMPRSATSPLRKNMLQRTASTGKNYGRTTAPTSSTSSAATSSTTTASSGRPCSRAPAIPGRPASSPPEWSRSRTTNSQRAAAMSSGSAKTISIRDSTPIF